MFILSKGQPKSVSLIRDRANKQAGSKVSGSYREVDGKLHKKSGEINGNLVKDFGVRFNIWQYDNGYMKNSKDKISYKHPATFPEKLVEDHILSWSNPGDIVLDPMVGSGTVCKVARLLGRQYIGIDVSQDYIDIAKERLNGM